jgi:hypothetical protein
MALCLMQIDWKLKREAAQTAAHIGIILHFKERFEYL